MPTIEMKALKDVVPKYVNEAKEGKKYGSIKLADDTKYLVPKNMVSQLTAGVGAKIDTKKEAWTDVEIITHVAPTANYGAPKQNTRQRMDPADARGAYISLMNQAWASAGMIAVDRHAVAKARTEAGAGYDMGFNPQRRDDMDDEIPNWETNSENPAD